MERVACWERGLSACVSIAAGAQRYHWFRFGAAAWPTSLSSDRRHLDAGAAGGRWPLPERGFLEHRLIKPMAK
jgi:hypothetical protein